MAPQESTEMRRPRGRFGTIVTAVAAGFTGGLLAPLILPRLQRDIRPATKRLFKTGIALYERGREQVAELGELASDMMAEARAEYEAGQTKADGQGESIAENEVVRLRNGSGKEVHSPHA
jgi:hypothetical protein